MFKGIPLPRLLSFPAICPQNDGFDQRDDVVPRGVGGKVGQGPRRYGGIAVVVELDRAIAGIVEVEGTAVAAEAGEYRVRNGVDSAVWCYILFNLR
jgi:hypothetical protein